MSHPSYNKTAAMPRYYFNMMEGRTQNLVRDIDGALLADTGQARQEAIGLAQDITSHGLSDAMKAWNVVVTDESGAEVLSVPLAEIASRRAPVHAAGLAIRGGIAWLESHLGRGAVIWIMAVAAIAIVVQAGVTKMRLAQESGGYQTASAPTATTAGETTPGGAIVAVRFKPQTTVADVTRFLETYEAAMAGGPRPGNLYRLRIGHQEPAELAKIVDRMAQEPSVELAAAIE